MKLHTYLNYGGNCEEAFRFYEQHLGAKIVFLMPFGKQPVPDAPPGWDKAIQYGRIHIGGTDLMGNDVVPQRHQSMRSAYLSLTLDSSEEAERVYALLSDGGQIFMPIQEMFFAHRFAMLRDKFGASWMLLHERPAA